MIDQAASALLQEIVRRESFSVLMYVSDAFPWTTARNSAALVKLQRLIADEKRALAALGQLLGRRHIPVTSLGSFPTSYTTINFLALEHIIPRLIDFERHSIAELERDLRNLKDADARTKVDQLLLVKRKNLSALEALAAPEPARV